MLRLDMIRTFDGATPTLPIMNSSTITWQRACPAMESIIANAASVREKLAGVAEGLRTAAPQLKAACVAPQRIVDSLSAASILGAAKQAANADLWETSVKHTTLACGGRPDPMLMAKSQ